MPTKPPKPAVLIRLDSVRERETVKRLARRHKVSMGAWMVQAIRERMERETGTKNHTPEAAPTSPA